MTRGRGLAARVGYSRPPEPYRCPNDPALCPCASCARWRDRLGYAPARVVEVAEGQFALIDGSLHVKQAKQAK